MEIFNPGNKTYNFSFDSYSCHKLATGKCSLDDISLDDLSKFENKYEIDESNENYCRSIAMMVLNDKFTRPAWITFYKPCNHYCFSDGQHRTCCAARLIQKGANVSINAKLETTEKYICRYCSISKSLERKKHIFNDMNPIKRFFKRKEYQRFLEDEHNFSEHDVLWTL